MSFVFRYHFKKKIFYFSQQRQKNWFLNGNSFEIRFVFNSIDRNCFIENHFKMMAWKMKWKPTFMAVFGVNHWPKINHPVKIISYRMKWLRGNYRSVAILWDFFEVDAISKFSYLQITSTSNSIQSNRTWENVSNHTFHNKFSCFSIAPYLIFYSCFCHFMASQRVMRLFPLKIIHKILWNNVEFILHSVYWFISSVFFGVHLFRLAVKWFKAKNTSYLNHNK